jgi:hypothetical protein
VSAETIIRRRIVRLEDRVRATADPVTPAQRGVHTRVVNLLRIEQRKLAAIEAGNPPWEWTSMPLRP